MSLNRSGRQLLRIVDANFNRVGEGLRILEEIARFVLNDSELTQQLKTARHETIRTDLAFQQQLLMARDSQEDVGSTMNVPDESGEKDLPLIVIANSRRIQESLRILEELAKVPDISRFLDSEKFRQERFSVYTIEQKLVFRILRKDKIRNISGVYAVIDTESLGVRHHLEAARQVIKGGARVLQLRDKISPKAEVLAAARQLRPLCAEHSVLFIMNDYLDVALDCDADGIHVGQNDLPVQTARKLMPLDKLIGCSVETVEQALEAQSKGADYIGAGAVFATPTKTDIQTIGLETLRKIKQAVQVPVVAIGGINLGNLRDVIGVGADSAAVISAILGAESPEKATRQMIKVFEESSEQVKR